MDDLVSRQKVLRCIKESRENIDWGQSEDGDAFLHYSAALYRTIASKDCLPSEQQWILVSDRVPKKDGRYWAWCEIFIVPDHVDDPCSYYGGREASYLDGHWYGDNIGEVVAWMPLPKPYKESEE